MKFNSTVFELPKYGKPVLIVIDGKTQDITYCLDGADDVPDWFEPYKFDHLDSEKVWWNQVSHWAYIPEINQH